MTIVIDFFCRYCPLHLISVNSRKTLLQFRKVRLSANNNRIQNFHLFRLCSYCFSDFDYFRFPEVYSRIRKTDVEAFLNRAVTRQRLALCVIDPISKEETL